MIRVLHVVMGMDRGGIETLIMNIYRKIDRSKVQFDFLVHTEEKKSYDEEIYSLGGKIYSVPPRSKGIIRNKRALIDFFKKHNEYRIVHQHVSSLSYIEPIKTAKRFNIPVRVIHGHSTKQGGHSIHKLLHIFNQLSIDKHATHYFACSDRAARWMYGYGKLKNITWRIINNGIDSDLFIYDSKLRDTTRKKLNISDQMVIGHIGRFSYPKNHNFIIDIFEQIKKLEERAVLLLVGDGKLKSQIIEKLHEKGIYNSVIFTGVRSDTVSLLNAMDVFLFPSRYEGLGIAAIEAQSTGLKCFVSTEVPQEVMVTENIKRCSLEKSACEWAREILKYKNGYKRKSEVQNIKKNGFDICEVAHEMQNFYIDLGYI